MGDDQEAADQPTTISLEEEVDPQEQDVGAAGSVRSYECIFCKRGFTTAQALGGHMNIHRKDRAKSTSSRRLQPPNYLSNTTYNNNNSNNIQDHSFYANNPRSYHPIFASYDPQGNYISTSHNNHQEGSNIHYNISSTSSINYHENINYYHQDVDVDGVMKSSRLVDEFGWSHGVEDKDSRSRNIINRGGDDDIQEDELDLELRLGQI